MILQLAVTEAGRYLILKSVVLLIVTGVHWCSQILQ